MGDRPLEFWESLADRRIREATERGDFDDLPGAGEPIPDLGGTYDPHWWVKKWIRRTSLEATAAELRRTIRAELPGLKAAPESEGTNERIAELNRAIVQLNKRLATADRIDLIEG